MQASITSTLLALAVVPAAQPQAPASQPGSARVAAWTMFRGDLRLTGVAPEPRPERPSLLWRFETATARASLARSQPGLIPASQAAAGPEPIEATAAIIDGSVIFGCDDGVIYCVGLDDGKLRWGYPAGSPIKAAPAVAGKLAIAGDENGVVHAVDRSTGRQVWTFRTGAEVHASATIVEETALVGSYDGFLFRLRLSDGTLIWKYDAGDKLHGTPAVADSFALVAGCDAQLHVVNLSDGTAARTISLGSVCGVGAAGQGEIVALGTHGGTVVGVDWKAGELVWRFADPEREFPFMSSAAIFDGKAILGGRDKRIRALSLRDGKPVWTFVAGGRVDSSPVVWDGWAMVGSSDGILYAIEVSSGKKVWQYESGSPISASPAVAAGRLVIGTADGFLLCFGASR